MTSSADQEVVDTCVQLILAHVRDRSVGDWEVDSVLELVGDPRATVRQQVLERLVKLRVAVVPPGGDELDGRGPARLVDPSHREPFLADARRLLRRDRASSRPWDRLLTASEEVGLALLLRGEQYRPDEEVPHGYRAGLDVSDERARAFDAMVLHNRRLVISVAGSYLGHGLESEDLDQHGVVGLMRAVERFDPTRGLKFSTYAVWWIRQAVTRAVANESRLIRLPVHKSDQVRRVVASRNRLLTQSGTATVSDICHQLGMEPGTVLECLRLHAGVVSLDLLIGDGNAPLAEFVTPAQDTQRPDVVTQRQETLTLLRASLKDLPERSAAILIWRAGIGTGVPMTLDEIGRRLGVTRERVRQLEKKALPQLRERMRARLGGEAPRGDDLLD
ncbi:sigma-70 family RNA polymerase sigma factor [Micromonospora sp. C31]|uniref:sigma-70 family RNA polymerase sigma factor n=1 Tax=Micromonospora sp. C31 TaxID=2824876 RepID=UPI001B38B143|nr:sigma-70 family RNA polymerase sigma factor [Micromonospora sp. C31]MBQ1076642.1 sigma-70 family RNA polymerase sigma factor [Micromonospora sp. C31]